MSLVETEDPEILLTSYSNPAENRKLHLCKYEEHHQRVH